VRITWFSWKDINHPRAGGAEKVSDEIRNRLARDGHEVTLITSMYAGSTARDKVDGVRVLRSGGHFSVYWQARKVFKTLPQQDLVIDEMNTVPFMTTFYSKKTTNILLTYQLARQVWFYQMFFPLSIIGYLAEPLYLRLISKRYPLVLTESESTKKDLARFGFNNSNVEVFRVGMETVADKGGKKEGLAQKKPGQIVFLGAFRPMKRPIDAIKAFEAAHAVNPNLSLVMAGNNHGPYADKVARYVEQSAHRSAIHLKGRVTEEQKSKLLQESQAIIVTSIKEGWGLIVTEANSKGTPAVVYDADGLRDSVKDKVTGLVVRSGDTGALGRAIVDLLANPDLLVKYSKASLQDSRQYTFDISYQDFKHAVSKVIELA
jgi:glycosyltransferase involved in cell wall biosynthesis